MLDKDLAVLRRADRILVELVRQGRQLENDAERNVVRRLNGWTSGLLRRYVENLLGGRSDGT